MATFVDAEAAVKAWVNALTGLVGDGNALVKGAMLTRPHGDPPTWAELQVTSSSAALSAENPDHRAGVSFLVCGRTREAAARAATALCNELESLSGRPVPAGSNAVALVADNVSGPVFAPDAAGPRYLVSCDVYLRAA